MLICRYANTHTRREGELVIECQRISVHNFRTNKIIIDVPVGKCSHSSHHIFFKCATSLPDNRIKCSTYSHQEGYKQVIMRMISKPIKQ